MDTGFHGSIADWASRERSRNLGAVGRVMGDARGPAANRGSAAEARGIDPADVGLIVMTHLRFDHASALRDFPTATVLVSSPEWQAARGRYPFMHGYVPAQLDPRTAYRTVDFFGAPAAETGPFERTVDLFGDGSLTLAFTPATRSGTSR